MLSLKGSDKHVNNPDSASSWIATQDWLSSGEFHVHLREDCTSKDSELLERIRFHSSSNSYNFLIFQVPNWGKFIARVSRYI